MKLLIFSDTHTNWEVLRKLLNTKVDYYICLGDITTMGSGLEEAGNILSSLKNKLLIVQGNNESQEQVEYLCQKYNFIFFHNNIFKVKKYNLAGIGFFRTGYGLGVNEEKTRKSLDNLKETKNLLLFTHAPPYNTKLDHLPPQGHIGCKALKKFIDQYQPLYSFSGHIHENQGRQDIINKTKCYLVGSKGFKLNL